MYSPLLFSIIYLLEIILSTSTTSTEEFFNNNSFISPIILALYDIFMTYIVTSLFWKFISSQTFVESYSIQTQLLLFSFYSLLSYFIIISTQSIPNLVSTLIFSTSQNIAKFSFQLKSTSLYILIIHMFISFYLMFNLSISNFSLSLILSFYFIPLCIYITNHLLHLFQQSNNFNLTQSSKTFSFLKFFFSSYIPLSFVILASFIISFSSFQSELHHMILNVQLVL